MRIEDVDGRLGQLARLLSSISTELDGQGPIESGGWYKLTRRSGSGYAWFRVVGERARKYPPNIVHLVVSPKGAFERDARLSVGQDWWGKEDRHVVLDPQDPDSVALGIEVLARAFRDDMG